MDLQTTTLIEEQEAAAAPETGSQKRRRSSAVSGATRANQKLPPPKIWRGSATTFKDPFGTPSKTHKGKVKEEVEEEKESEERITFRPSMGTRLDLLKTYCFMDIEPPKTKYVLPKSEKLLKEMAERRRVIKELLNFCEYDKKRLRLSKPPASKQLALKMEVPSPTNVNDAKVIPHPPSVKFSYPDLLGEDVIKARAPRSGIFINEKQPTTRPMMYDSFDLVFERKPRPKSEPTETVRKKKKKRKRRASAEGEGEERKRKKRRKKKVKEEPKQEEEELVGGELMGAGEFAKLFDYAGEDEDYYGGDVEEEEDTFAEESYLTKLFRRKVSQASKATSLHERDLLDFPSFMDEDMEQEPAISRLVQKFRRDSEMQRYRPPPKKIMRGTLESHSFTKLKQPTLSLFFFGSRAGTMHEGDVHFSEMSRGKQGICMPVAAFCFSVTKHPVKWTEQNMDDILEIGDELYNESMKERHFHEKSRELRGDDLIKCVLVGNKRIQYEISEPELSGTVRSRKKEVYNLTKALRIFFKRNCAGIFQCEGQNLLLWRDQFYYMFDATPRAKDLFPDPKQGTAVMANFYDIPSIVTVLLKRTDLGNLQFVISKIRLKRIKRKHDDDEDASEASQPELEPVPDEKSVFNIVGTGRAVVQGSFNLADRCFDFGRNKQAVPMAAVCLVYSRISPPNAWRRRTIDKIMIIGNQLYWEVVKEHPIAGELTLDMLPAVFTVGPYIVNIFIYAKIFADLMFRKSQCMILKCLEDFFEKNTNAIVQIGKCTIAIWFQRDQYYCFDPYARNSQGLKAREGTACVSMNNELATLVEAITTNFDNKDDVFYLHAMKVIKINRDPDLSMHFPISIPMDSYPLDKFKKCKIKHSFKKATQKPITVDLKDFAMKTRFAWDGELEPSILEMSSNIYSLNSEEIPPMIQKAPSKTALKQALEDMVADLDSPSLSDTQIEPERLKYEDVEVDQDSFELTMEEQELMGPMGEGEDLYLSMEGYGGGYEQEGELDIDDIDEMYLAMNAITQVGSQSLESYHSKISVEVNTDITCGFLPLPREELPATNLGERRRLQQELEIERRRVSVYDKFPPESALMLRASEEWKKESNFVDLPDGSQLIRGTTNMSSYGADVEFMGPFVAMMAAAVAQKFTVMTWSPKIVDYVLKCGKELYAASKVRYDQVPILDIPRVTLGRSDIKIHVEYLYDSAMKQKTLENCLKRILFPRNDCGLVVTASYSCAVFFRDSLFYMFDGFGCNELGLGEGPANTGVACFARFRTVHELVTRIIHNKSKRETVEEFGYTQFVLSLCKAQCIIVPEKREIISKRRSKMDAEREQEMMADEGEGEGVMAPRRSDRDVKKPQPHNKVGYQFEKGFNMIRGTRGLKSPNAVSATLKADHFVCLCAGMMLLNCPVKKWDTEKVDYVLEQGEHVFKHAEDLCVSEKRIIRNVLIDCNFFDVLVKRVEIADWRLNKNLETGIDTLLGRKWNYFLIQFPNMCYLLHKHKDFFHLFDPYSCSPKGRKGGGAQHNVAGWTMYMDLRQIKRRIRKDLVQGAEQYNFYTFELMTIKKAPKKVVVAQKLKDYEKHPPPKKEEKMDDRPYFEDEAWLEVDPIPWSRVQGKLASGEPRGLPEYMWHDWDVELPKSLYSLFGNLHQNSEHFSAQSRGKQTLANLVVAIGMTQIYEFEEWNTAVMDSILVHGDSYFKECTKEFTEEDYELGLEDLKGTCTIFPYTFDVRYIPVVDGTVFLLRTKQFNLYKGLRAFFDFYESRCGIVCVSKEGRKKLVAFGKTQEKEYFMYDCTSFGPPMFLERQGTAYVLRCTRLKRLLHVMVVTLRGGDFYIYEVEVSNFKPMKAE